MQQSVENIVVKLISSPEWQRSYKNFVYLHAHKFAKEDQKKQIPLFEEFKALMQPIHQKFLTKEQYEWQCKNLEALDSVNRSQFLSCVDFKVFQEDMAAQNEMLDLVALEMIRREQGEVDDDDDDDDDEYFEQQRMNIKSNIQGLKKELEQTIQLQVSQLKDQFGFNIENNCEEDLFKKSIEFRTENLKKNVPKLQIKLTAEQLKKRRLQAEAIKRMIDLQDKRQKEIKDCFDEFDKDNNGQIPTKDLINVLKGLEQDPNEEELRQWISELDPEENGMIDFLAFMKLITRVLKDDDTLEELLESFKVFDVEKNGLIATAEMRYILIEMGEKMSPQDVKDVLKEMDPDDSGFCKYEDYVKKKYEDLQVIKAKAAKLKAKKKKK